MGLFDFVKDAGEKLTDKVLGDSAGEHLTKTVEIAPERLDQLRREHIARAVSELPIDGEQVSIDVNGSTAVLKGRAPNREALEKIVLCAGNQHGIEQVDCQMEVDEPVAAAEPAAEATAPAAANDAPAASPAEQESTFYTVQSGDTLGKIAQEHYGAASKYTAIFEANQPMLTDPDKIYAGQKLRIPNL